MSVDEAFDEWLGDLECDEPEALQDAFIAGFHAGQASRPPAPAWTSEPPKELGKLYLVRARGDTRPHEWSIERFSAGDIERIITPGPYEYAGPIPEPPA